MKKKALSRTFVRMKPLPWIGGHTGSLVFFALAVLCLVFSVTSPQTVRSVRTGAADIVSPVVAILGKPIQDAAFFVRNVSGLAQIQAENERLKDENQRLQEWYQSALVLEAENKSFRELLNIKLEPQNRYITARVLADPGQSFVKSLLVMAGKNHGVAREQAVISGDGLIGRVIETGSRSARVLLVTDINSRVPVLVENSRQHAILAGNNEHKPFLLHLPVGSNVEEGARIVTSGHGGVFPAGLPVGRVMMNENGQPEIALFTDLNRLTHVRIIDRPEDPNLRSGVLN